MAHAGSDLLACGNSGSDMRARFGFTLITLAAAVGLLAWGAFVTSIDAGMAVPDWPTSFSSYDPFNPWPEWWTMTPVLAEHGHRLLGALVGLLTLGLAVWSWISDRRRWLGRVAVGALGLVILQGVLGGLRVVWVSPALAVVHALTAQLFFALLVSMAFFTSASWHRLPGSVDRDGPFMPRLRAVGPVAVGAVYVQIVLGALLRHPGTGIDPTLALLHISWALVTAGFVIWHSALLSKAVRPACRAVSRALAAVVLLQVLLGFLAWFVLLDERGMLRPSNLQVIVNSLHLVTGAVLFSTNVLAVLVARRAAFAPEPEPIDLQPA